ncbi:hypothetical protein L798_07828 [Zootermopsis nevadensis]|uniref:Uncharacterized protein n=1 Tax=Zootermopsis nevadensis TaxID=136037 RepID=A0A067R2X4_ZOONE|nr:hypothetical protein L798_07828 [Zootermopsis nevadensis]
MTEGTYKSRFIMGEKLEFTAKITCLREHSLQQNFCQLAIIKDAVNHYKTENRWQHKFSNRKRKSRIGGHYLAGDWNKDSGMVNILQPPTAEWKGSVPKKLLVMAEQEPLKSIVT